MARSNSFTFEQGLVKRLTDTGWFANPAGIEGFVVFVLERRGREGNRVHCTLQPGETLRLDERLFGRYEAYAVDVRVGRSFPISGQFDTAELNRSITLSGSVTYRVIDPRKVAVGTVDPLDTLRNKVIAALGEKLVEYPQGQVTRSLCAKIIAGAGYQEQIGLAVEGADILEFAHDQGVVGRLAEREDLQHRIEVERMENEAQLAAEMRQEQQDLEIQKMWVSELDLRDPNVLMRQHPNLIPDVIARLDERDRMYLQQHLALEEDKRQMLNHIVKAYVQQEMNEGGVIDLDALARFVEERLRAPGLPGESESGQKRIGFGETIEGSSGRIEFGDEEGGAPQNPKRIVFDEPYEKEKE